MKIIISPAKKMVSETDIIDVKELPVFIKKAEKLSKHLKTLSYDELKALLCCNDEIATLSFSRFQKINLYENLSPAILSFDGIQYKYMSPKIFSYDYFDYIENHLRILSGFYGVLKPHDGVIPYRLEMQAKLKTDFCSNLYEYWGRALYDEITKDTDTIINLASYEYSKIIEKYLDNNIKYITCIFGELICGKVVEKGVYVKMARGEMVRFMAENNISDLEELKHFDRLGFEYNKELSSPANLVFIKQSKLK